MKIHVLGSSSNGNCYVIENNVHYLVLDAGCKFSDVQRACGFNVMNIDAVLLTHCHMDHASNYRDFVKSGIPVYSNKETADSLMQTHGEKVFCLKDKTFTNLDGGRYRVAPFYVPHEETHNSAFIVIWEDGTKLFYATDFEYIPFTVKSWNIDHFLIAVNHSEEIPEDAEAREHRLRGHSSLETVKRFLELSVTDNCKSVTACHLSGEYADPDRIQTELRSILGNNIQVNIARRGETINL
jgi:phosphoribosyl 1,2-cyclic phosphodiesterase